LIFGRCHQISITTAATAATVSTYVMDAEAVDVRKIKMIAFFTSTLQQ
jgi:hypothetical protein